MATDPPTKADQMTNRCARFPRWIGVLAVIGLAAGAGWAPAYAQSQSTVRVGGTGMALAAMRQVGENLTSIDRSVTIEVLPSLGTPGGLRALDDRAIDVAVIGRPLTDNERVGGFSQVMCLATPLLFATSHPSPPGIARADVPGFYSRPNPTWPDGTPLKILLRSRAGSENGYLVAAIPGMADALENAYKTPGVPVATTDQENAELALRIDGSFAIMTLLQIRGERLRLQMMPLDGVAPTLDNVSARTYPLVVRVCVVVPASPTSGAAKFVEYLSSGPGLALMRSLGAVPVK